MPLRPLARPDGKPLTIEVQFPGASGDGAASGGRRRAACRSICWIPTSRQQPRRPRNHRPTLRRRHRDAPQAGDPARDRRVSGPGGLGLKPAVYHMNEGHSAFLAPGAGASADGDRQSLLQRGPRGWPRPASSSPPTRPCPPDTITSRPDLMDRYFGDYFRGLGVSRQDFLALGRQNPCDNARIFCMTVLALRLAATSNGVSRLHGEVSRHMWQGIWPGVPEEEIPIGHVTNGVHFRTWISAEMNQLYDRYLGPRWREEPADEGVLERAGNIPAEELWRTHERRRERLVAFARGRLTRSVARRGAPPLEIEAADEMLDPEALTIGFARRFATYKRANLILRDTDRLARILNDPNRPVQIIFAGKAHPHDDDGKELIRQIVHLARDRTFRRRVVFLEDYDMAVARYLVQGV